MAWVQVGDKSLNGYERNHLFLNENGHFRDVAYLAGADRIEDGRGVAAFDFDRDGRLDLVVNHVERPAVLLRNRGGRGHWLAIELEGSRPRDPVGARVVVEAGGRSQTRTVAAAAGYVSGPSRICHFGLGSARRVERITIHWPRGGKTVLRDVAANQRLRVAEKAG